MLQLDKVSKRSDCVGLKKIINNVYITRTHGIVNASFWIRAFFVARSSFETARFFFNGGKVTRITE